MNGLESGVIATDALIHKTGASVLKNSGKIIAAIAAVLAILLTFTDVSFSAFGTESFSATLIMMLIAAYLIYFSLEDAGERLGEESAEYLDASRRYMAIREKISGADIELLRTFCTEYSATEAAYRRACLLTRSGYSEKEYAEWLEGHGDYDRKTKRLFRRIKLMKNTGITPSMLLSGGKATQQSELSDPARYKLLRLALKLLPTTVGMGMTVSVILTMKDGLSAGTVIEGILKLATLPIVAFRGYTAGYSYTVGCTTPWIESKTKILEAFLSEKSRQ